MVGFPAVTSKSPLNDLQSPEYHFLYENGLAESCGVILMGSIRFCAYAVKI